MDVRLKQFLKGNSRKVVDTDFRIPVDEGRKRGRDNGRGSGVCCWYSEL